ncbi:MAG: hypothetical protein HQ541_22220, partial [Mariniphaga sp.]|nr:hypothetical protein [Mariniphaga sp.]
DSYPWLSVYKTKGNYLNYITVGVDSLGNIFSSPDYTYRSGQVGKKDNGEVYFKYRYVLKSGYIVSLVSIHQAFTDITLKEYIEYNEANGIAGWTDNLIYPRIIDRDPFIEFYFSSCMTCTNSQQFSLGEINEMLENGTIEEHFTKLK